MNIHKIILAVLAAATIAVGTTTVAVHADGPDINDFMDAETKRLFQELVPDSQSIVRLAWDAFREMAPREAWTDVMRQVVSQIHEEDRASGSTGGGSAPSAAAPGVTGASQSCNPRGTVAMNTRSGWAGAATLANCTMDYLQAQVGARRYGSLRMCSDCTSVSADISLPTNECAYYSVYSLHQWGYNPTGGTSLGTEGYVGC